MAADALPAPAGPLRLPYRRIAAAVLALLFLNGMLSFKEWWPTPGVLPDHRLAPEFVWLWLALLAAVGLGGALSRRALAAFTLVYLRSWSAATPTSQCRACSGVRSTCTGTGPRSRASCGCRHRTSPGGKAVA